jgi:hypothetical protein
MNKIFGVLLLVAFSYAGTNETYTAISAVAIGVIGAPSGQEVVDNEKLSPLCRTMVNGFKEKVINAMNEPVVCYNIKSSKDYYLLVKKYNCSSNMADSLESQLSSFDRSRCSN